MMIPADRPSYGLTSSLLTGAGGARTLDNLISHLRHDDGERSAPGRWGRSRRWQSSRPAPDPAAHPGPGNTR